MDVLSTLRRWVRSLLGREEGAVDRATGEAEPAGTTAEPTHECAICGTPVEGPGEPCPLCRSTDVVPVGEGGSDDPGETPGARETTVRGESRTVAEVLGSADILTAYEERWERRGSGYRVTLPDGATERVASKDELRRVLFREYGPPDGG